MEEVESWIVKGKRIQQIHESLRRKGIISNVGVTTHEGRVHLAGALRADEIKKLKPLGLVYVGKVAYDWEMPLTSLLKKKR